jgi:hypothetical protein
MNVMNIYKMQKMHTRINLEMKLERGAKIEERIKVEEKIKVEEVLEIRAVSRNLRSFHFMRGQ